MGRGTRRPWRVDRAEVVFGVVDDLQVRLEANLRLIDLLSPEVASADGELRQFFRADPASQGSPESPGSG